jgi:hypothetical protein
MVRLAFARIQSQSDNELFLKLFLNHEGTERRKEFRLDIPASRSWRVPLALPPSLPLSHGWK